jgi:hypothetical protein
VHSIGYSLHSSFLLAISYRNQQFSQNSYFSVGSAVSRELPQRLTLNTFFVDLSFLVVCLHSVTIFVLTFLCVSHSNLLIFVLLLLCLSTILAPSCPASCQPSCSPPPSSGCIRAAWFHPFSRSMMAPTQFCAAAPVPSPSESGHGTRWSPSAALRLAWPRTPRLAACAAAADR